jgi:tyrosine-protein phosphatase SIW14
LISTFVRRFLAGAVACLVIIVPFVDYRYQYTFAKRLREIVPDRVYRSGQLTAPGFANAVRRFGFRTIVNLQDDYPDPDIARGYFTGDTVKESELCRQLGVRYLFIAPDVIPRREIGHVRPTAIDQFLAVMDDPSNYPVLFHCKAGLHRTGIMAAIYRMEYQGWSHHEAIAELKENGFGEWPATSANDYIAEYVLAYQPGLRIKDSPLSSQ